MVQALSFTNASTELSRRLRQLRADHWPHETITQKTLANALGVGVPSISMWESHTAPKIPTLTRLDDYATFFATKRSLTAGLLDLDELTENERTKRDKLARELYRLHEAATGVSAPSENPVLPSFWQFPDGAPILIVCGELLPEDRTRFASAADYNYMQLSAYADIDSMVELFGHIRTLNPTSDVRFELAPRLTSDDLQSHLVVLGGVGLNTASRFLPKQAHFPVRQSDDADGGRFELTEDPERRFYATFDNDVLVEDVGLFARTPNPANVSRTLTMCNGIFTRGVYGAVRCLTDAVVGFKNYEHLASRFGNAKNFGLLMRVQVFDHATPSPDLTNPATVLYEWPPH
ncbi:helix-turn-helix transcriptional regulator [Amycolatopsis sp.]|jgi:transcriptional regulator with XRE-family HTH domain|uniref:helix-turn-helix domain-containing protein n=1 Tax=Amycolatopsis sp. TaxID=37632 RepID=UPI002E0B4D90|nr:helix-turn-helix transcriptional regulator [Amycolatopsis sp.]